MFRSLIGYNSWEKFRWSIGLYGQVYYTILCLVYYARPLYTMGTHTVDTISYLSIVSTTRNVERNLYFEHSRMQKTISAELTLSLEF